MQQTSKNAVKTRGRPFQPGNKFGRGRPKGSRNKATIALEALIDGEGEEVVRAIISSAKGGDMAAARALLDRLVPPRRERPITFELPPLDAPANLAEVTASILQGLASGSLLPEQGKALLAALAEHVKAVELQVLEERIQKLEILNEMEPL